MRCMWRETEHFHIIAFGQFRGEGGMQVHLTQTSLTNLFRGDKGGGGLVLNVFSEGSNDLFQRKL